VKGRDKMKHLTGNPPPPAPTDTLFQKWDVDDSIVKGWLINSLDPKLQSTFIRYPTAKEVWDAIATTFYDGNDKAQVYNLNKKVTRLKQLDRTVEDYYHELQGLWREIDYRRPNPMVHPEDITKFNEFVQETRVYTFLDGLDDRLNNVRAAILQMASFPTIEQAYAIVRRETSRQVVMLKGEEEINSSIAMVTRGYKHPEVNFASNKSLSKQERSKLKCNHCGGTGHLKEGCFKLIGYPDWYHEKRAKQQSDKRKGKANLVAAATTCNIGLNNAVKQVQEGLERINSNRNWTELTNQESSSNPGPGQAHLVRAEHPGNTGFVSQTEAAGKQVGQGMKSLSNKSLNNWIIDSGATDHMTFSKNDLINMRKPTRDMILNANGVGYPVESTEDVHLSGTLNLKDTLLVPSLSTRLLSVGQLIDELNCVALMFPNHCIFQDILTKEIIGRGIKKGRLYHLEDLKI
jgi:gag-polypeptide of LTR copia-type